MDQDARGTDLQHALRYSAPCAVSVGGLGGGSGPVEHLPLAIVVAGFLAVGVWMFRRYGKGSAPSEAPEAQAPAHSGSPAARPVAGNAASASS